jgi:Tol biopolymer transport system component
MTVDLPPRTVVPVSFEVQCSGIVRREVIAYSVDSTISAKSPTYIGLARPDGSEPGILGSGSWPSWSPDGKKLAYSDFTCVDFGSYYDYCKSVIMTVDPETLDSRVIAEGTMPAWSPKGDVVALVQTDGSLRLVPFDGSGPLRKVAIPGALLVAAPAWSPDGTMIAFECHENNKFFRLCVINSDGTGFRQLTDDTSDPVGHPAWSRDGSVIAFSSIRVAETVIATIPALGGAITTLTSGYDPAWSPDGTKLVFARAGGLFTMNRDGSNVQQLTSGTHRDPAWRP